VAAGTDFAELNVSPAGLFWSEFRPQDAATRIWRWKASAPAAGFMNTAVVRSA
jgi:hypothetical protein